jgi:hypothetical protein
MIRTMQGKIDAWNRRASDLYGWRKEEAIGRISHDLLQTRFPQPLEEIEQELVRKGQWEGKLVHTRRDGSRVIVDSRWVLDRAPASEVVVETNQPLEEREGVGGSEELLARIAKAANVFLVGAGMLAAFLTLYVIYNHYFIASRPFSSTILYCLPAALAVLMFWATRLKPNEKINFALAVIACGTVLYGTEISLKVLDMHRSRCPACVWLLDGLSQHDKQKRAQQMKEQFGVQVDTRNRLQVLADLSKEGIDAVPGFLPRVLLLPDLNQELKKIEIGGREVVPLGGVSNKLTVLCNEPGHWVTYESDERGFNNPRGIWQSANIDIAAVGDSFTQGYCVPREKSFVGLLRQRYPATLNLGMAADGPLYMLASLREYLPHFRPKVVLWFYFEGNDLWDLAVENNIPVLRQYLRPEFRQGLAAFQPDLDAVLVNYIQAEAAKELHPPRLGVAYYSGMLLQIIKLSTIRERFGLLNLPPTPDENVPISEIQGGGVPAFSEVLSRAKADVSGWGGTLYFVYLPTWERYSGHLNVGVKRRQEVLSMVRGLGLPLIDLAPRFDESGDPLSLFPFRGSGHYNENGHSVVAAEALRVISSAESRDRKQ